MSGERSEEMDKTVKEIIEEYLKKNGYDGLYNADGNCGCCLDDLCPCGIEGIENCKVGYKRPYNPETDEDIDETDWVITEKKES